MVLCTTPGTHHTGTPEMRCIISEQDVADAGPRPAHTEHGTHAWPAESLLPHRHCVEQLAHTSCPPSPRAPKTDVPASRHVRVTDGPAVTSLQPEPGACGWVRSRSCASFASGHVDHDRYPISITRSSSTALRTHCTDLFSLLKQL